VIRIQLVKHRALAAARRRQGLRFSHLRSTATSTAVRRRLAFNTGSLSQWARKTQGPRNAGKLYRRLRADAGRRENRYRRSTGVLHLRHIPPRAIPRSSAFRYINCGDWVESVGTREHCGRPIRDLQWPRLTHVRPLLRFRGVSAVEERTRNRGVNALSMPSFPDGRIAVGTLLSWKKAPRECWSSGWAKSANASQTFARATRRRGTHSEADGATANATSPVERSAARVRSSF